MLVKGESKDQARMEALTDESRASRLKFLALSERLRQMTRLRDQVRNCCLCLLPQGSKVQMRSNMIGRACMPRSYTRSLLV